MLRNAQETATRSVDSRPASLRIRARLLRLRRHHRRHQARQMLVRAGHQHPPYSKVATPRRRQRKIPNGPNSKSTWRRAAARGQVKTAMVLLVLPPRRRSKPPQSSSSLALPSLKRRGKVVVVPEEGTASRRERRRSKRRRKRGLSARCGKRGRR